MAVATTILFLYGSLKRGHINHRQMAGQEYLGDVVTEPRYRLLDLGKYPGLIRDAAAGVAVRGELWAVTADHLPGLDAFEGGEGLYARRPIAVVGRNDVESYFWLGPVPPDVPSLTEWPLPPG